MVLSELCSREKFHKHDYHYGFSHYFGCGAGACLNRVLMGMEAGVGGLSIRLGVG